nr:uncharacterized protein LOC112587556 [Bubalus bubalis]
MHQPRPLRLSMWTGVGLSCHRLASVATAAPAAAAAPPPRALLLLPPGSRPRPAAATTAAAAPSAAPPREPGLSRGRRGCGAAQSPAAWRRPPGPRWRGPSAAPARPTHAGSGSLAGRAGAAFGLRGSTVA